MVVMESESGGDSPAEFLVISELPASSDEDEKDGNEELAASTFIGTPDNGAASTNLQEKSDGDQVPVDISTEMSLDEQRSIIEIVKDVELGAASRSSPKISLTAAAALQTGQLTTAETQAQVSQKYIKPESVSMPEKMPRDTVVQLPTVQLKTIRSSTIRSSPLRSSAKSPSPIGGDGEEKEEGEISSDEEEIEDGEIVSKQTLRPLTANTAGGANVRRRNTSLRRRESDSTVTTPRGTTARQRALGRSKSHNSAALGGVKKAKKPSKRKPAAIPVVDDSLCASPDPFTALLQEHKVEQRISHVEDEKLKLFTEVQKKKRVGGKTGRVKSVGGKTTTTAPVEKVETSQLLEPKCEEATEISESTAESKEADNSLEMLRMVALKSVAVNKTRAKMTSVKPAPQSRSDITEAKQGEDKPTLNDTLNVSNLSTVDIAEVVTKLPKVPSTTDASDDDAETKLKRKQKWQLLRSEKLSNNQPVVSVSATSESAPRGTSPHQTDSCIEIVDMELDSDDSGSRPNSRTGSLRMDTVGAVVSGMMGAGINEDDMLYTDALLGYQTPPKIATSVSKPQTAYPPMSKPPFPPVISLDGEIILDVALPTETPQAPPLPPEPSDPPPPNSEPSDPPPLYSDRLLRKRSGSRPAVYDEDTAAVSQPAAAFVPNVSSIVSDARAVIETARTRRRSSEEGRLSRPAAYDEDAIQLASPTSLISPPLVREWSNTSNGSSVLTSTDESLDATASSNNTPISGRGWGGAVAGQKAARKIRNKQIKQKKAQDMMDRLGTPGDSTVLVGMQTSTKSVSQMTERELRTEVAAVSLRIMELTSRLPEMNPGKSKTNKRTRIANLGVFKNKIMSILEMRQAERAESIQLSTAAAAAAMSQRNTVKSTQGISEVLTMTDPQEQYQAFMSHVGDTHNKIYTPVSQPLYVPTSIQKLAAAASAGSIEKGNERANNMIHSSANPDLHSLTSIHQQTSSTVTASNMAVSTVTSSPSQPFPHIPNIPDMRITVSADSIQLPTHSTTVEQGMYQASVSKASTGTPHSTVVRNKIASNLTVLAAASGAPWTKKTFSTAKAKQKAAAAAAVAKAKQLRTKQIPQRVAVAATKSPAVTTSVTSTPATISQAPAKPATISQAAAKPATISQAPAKPAISLPAHTVKTGPPISKTRPQFNSRTHSPTPMHHQSQVHLSPWRIQPVVIHLRSGDDSSSDEETTSTNTATQNKSAAVPEGLDMFLRAMKEQTPVAKPVVRPTHHQSVRGGKQMLSPTSDIKHLPFEKQQEYMKMKEVLRKQTEKQQKIKARKAIIAKEAAAAAKLADQASAPQSTVPFPVSMVAVTTSTESTSRDTSNPLLRPSSLTNVVKAAVPARKEPVPLTIQPSCLPADKTDAHNTGASKTQSKPPEALVSSENSKSNLETLKSAVSSITQNQTSSAMSINSLDNAVSTSDATTLHADIRKQSGRVIGSSVPIHTEAVGKSTMEVSSKSVSSPHKTKQQTAQPAAAVPQSDISSSKANRRMITELEKEIDTRKETMHRLRAQMENEYKLINEARARVSVLKAQERAKMAKAAATKNKSTAAVPSTTGIAPTSGVKSATSQVITASLTSADPLTATGNEVPSADAAKVIANSNTAIRITASAEQLKSNTANVPGAKAESPIKSKSHPIHKTMEKPGDKTPIIVEPVPHTKPTSQEGTATIKKSNPSEAKLQNPRPTSSHENSNSSDMKVTSQLKSSSSDITVVKGPVNPLNPLRIPHPLSPSNTQQIPPSTVSSFTAYREPGIQPKPITSTAKLLPANKGIGMTDVDAGVVATKRTVKPIKSDLRKSSKIKAVVPATSLKGKSWAENVTPRAADSPVSSAASSIPAEPVKQVKLADKTSAVSTAKTAVNSKAKSDTPITTERPSTSPAIPSTQAKQMKLTKPTGLTTSVSLTDIEIVKEIKIEPIEKSIASAASEAYEPAESVCKQSKVKTYTPTPLHAKADTVKTDPESATEEYDPTQTCGADYPPKPKVRKIDPEQPQAKSIKQEVDQTDRKATVGYNPTPIVKREDIAGAGAAGVVGESDAGSSVDDTSDENRRKMRALERAMHLKLRAKFAKKKAQLKANAASVPSGSESGELIPVPKLTEQETAPPPPKRRRSSILTESPRRQNSQKEDTEQSQEEASSSGSKIAVKIMPINWPIRKKLIHESKKMLDSLQGAGSNLSNELDLLMAAKGRCTQRVLSSLPDRVKPTKRDRHTELSLSSDRGYTTRSKQYSSVLKVFDSYRLNPYLRLQERISPLSSTYMHSIDPRLSLCKYDLHGTCNDTSCQHLHMRDYSLSLEDGILKLRSYGKQQPKENVKEFITKCRSSRIPMSDEDIMIYCGANVLGILKQRPPHTVQFDGPEVTMAQSDRLADVILDENKITTSPSKSVSLGKPQPQTKASAKANSEAFHLQNFDDNMIFGDDLRYYMDGTTTIPDMEQSLTENPHDIQIWMKLAYNKLHEKRSQQEGVSEALHIVSLALENNPSCLDLWLLYLKLYARQEESDRSDYTEVCERALEKQPNYHIFCLYIESLCSVRMRLEAYSHIAQFIHTDETMSDSEKSFVMLQSLLYHTKLVLMSDHISDVRLRLCMEIDCMEYSLLTEHDRTLASYYLAYYTAYRSLPQGLFQGANLVSRDPVHINWADPTPSRQSLHEVKGILTSVLAKTSGSTISSSQLAVRKALLSLCSREECMKRTESWLYETDGSLVPENHIMYSQELIKVNPQRTQAICNTSVNVLPNCAKLHYYCTLWAHDSKASTKQRCDYARQYALSLYPDSQAKHQLHTDQLFRIALDYEVKAGSIAIPIPPILDKSLLDKYEENILYTWLLFAYCMEQTDSSCSGEVYETAMCRTGNPKHINTICWQYIVSCSVGCRSSSKTSNIQEYMDIVRRCLAVTPCKVTNEQGVSCTDFSFHNKVICYVGNMLHSSDVTPWYESWLEKHPDNTQLISRICERYLTISDYTSMSHVCRVVSERRLPDESLWIIYLSATVRQKRFKEALTLARKSVRVLPHSSRLWIKYLSIMMSISTLQHEIQQAMKECHDTDVNIANFVNNLPADIKPAT